MATTSAVYVQNACKSYGKREVLKNLCMHVPKGSIYGLLGSSGCGKTTLLSCIVGRRQLNSGEIWVLGGKPGTVESGVPGPKVGYMPQEIALVGEFTVKDAIYYFGRIFNMPEKKIDERFNELSNLLDLPPADRFIRNCSGGQQRRVSFAASMVQMPELLILDEPTVGVDPILRERIWDYLLSITSKTSTAVIITTHYIEEARQASLIGLMRNGRLLAEESPPKLLRMFNTEVLEEVFFILSQRQNDGQLNEILPSNSPLPIQNSNTDISLASYDTTRASTDVLTPNAKEKKPKKVGGYSLNGRRMKALLDKNWKQFYRNISGMIFVFLFPIVQNVAFLLAVGPDPKNIGLAVVNQESMTTLCHNFSMMDTAIPYDYSSCHYRNLSCRFLSYIEDPMLHKIRYDDLSEAMADARHGKVVGVMFLAENFTESFEARIEKGRSVDPAALSLSEIKIWLDMSNRQIGATIKYKLLALYRDFQKDLMKDCNYDPKMADFFNLTTYYGNEDDTFTEYMTPGLIITIMFFMMTLMTSQIIVTDRCEGLWDRSIIAGVSSLEISITHFIMQIGIVIVYTATVLIITFWLFHLKYVGSMWILALLTFLQGINGVGYVMDQNNMYSQITSWTETPYTRNIQTTDMKYNPNQNKVAWETLGVLREDMFKFKSQQMIKSLRSMTYGQKIMPVLAQVMRQNEPEIILFMEKIPLVDGIVNVLRISGFWISIVSYNVSMANVITTGSFYIMILICGSLWPIEGMPVFLQWISRCLPFTIAMDSFRNVMQKGWPIVNFQVWNGMAIEVIWIIIFAIVNTILIQSKR